MKKLFKLINFLNINNLKKESIYLQKIARESDRFYIEGIIKIIDLFKTNPIILPSNNPHELRYQIDLNNLKISHYKFFSPRRFGDFLDLSIYHPDENRWQKEGGMYTVPYGGANPKISLFPNPQQWVMITRSGDILQNLINLEETLLAHEVSHFLNDTRFNNPKDINSVSTYGRENTGTDSFGYINSTEEVHSRIMAAIHFIMMELFERDLDKNINDIYHQKWLPIYKNKNGSKNDIYLANIIHDVVSNDLNSFLNRILSASTKMYIGNEDLLEKTRKRYLKRLYDLFVNLQNKFNNIEEEEGDSFPNPDDYYLYSDE
jgi:hypothetical protein